MPSTTSWPPIRAQIAGGEGTPVHISQTLERHDLPGYEIKSSRAAPVPEQPLSWLSERSAFLIAERATSEGQRKGRVLTVFRSGRPVAMCAWHFGDGPPAVYELACHPKLNAREREYVEEVVLFALRSIADTTGSTGTELRFSDQPLERAPKDKKAEWKGDLRQRAEELGFSEKVRPLPNFFRGYWVRKRVWRSFP
jgi:hypothetical protein